MTQDISTCLISQDWQLGRPNFISREGSAESEGRGWEEGQDGEARLSRRRKSEDCYGTSELRAIARARVWLDELDRPVDEAIAHAPEGYAHA